MSDERPRVKLSAEEWYNRVDVMPGSEDMKRSVGARIWFDESDDRPGDWHRFHDRWCRDHGEVDHVALLRALCRLGYRRQVATELPMPVDPAMEAISPESLAEIRERVMTRPVG